MIGLRPLAAGKVFEVLNKREDDLLNSLIPGTDLSQREKQIGLALRYCCGFEEVKTNVLSINSMEQAKELKKIIDKMPPVSKEQLVLLEASDGR
jgi:predicted aldo/keto reductase-like oxidoreductase